MSHRETISCAFSEELLFVRELAHWTKAGPALDAMKVAMMATLGSITLVSFMLTEL